MVGNGILAVNHTPSLCSLIYSPSRQGSPIIIFVILLGPAVRGHELLKQNIPKEGSTKACAPEMWLKLWPVPG